MRSLRNGRRSAQALGNRGRFIPRQRVALRVHSAGPLLERIVRREDALDGLGNMDCGAGGFSLASSAELLLEAVRTVRPDADPLLVIVSLLNGRGRREFERVFSGADTSASIRGREQGT